MAGLAKSEAVEMLGILAREFDIPAPSLSWSQRVKRGSAHYLRNLIVAGPCAWRGAEACLIHEFAHILNHRRHFDGFAVRGLKRKSHHGAEFMQALLDTIIAWYGDASAYPWKTEYRTIAAFGATKTAVSAKPQCPACEAKSMIIYRSRTNEFLCRNCGHTWERDAVRKDGKQ